MLGFSCILCLSLELLIGFTFKKRYYNLYDAHNRILQLAAQVHKVHKFGDMTLIACQFGLP